jgi:4-alpha-glucanotransferase
VEENSVAYTGTHDNDTSLGWWESATPAVRDHARRVAADAGIDEEEPTWLLIRLALSTRARTAIVPVQDVLGLGSDARMNTPGREDGNWQFRLEPGQLDGPLAARLRKATRFAGR